MELVSLTVLDLIKGIIGAINNVKSTYDKFDGEFEKIKSSLKSLGPRVNEVRWRFMESADPNATDDLRVRRREEMDGLVQTLKECQVLVDKCAYLSYLRFFKVKKYAEQLSAYNIKINDFIQVVMISDIWVQTRITEKLNYGSALPEPGFTVGWVEPVSELKHMLLQENISVLGISGLGGCGKTTLVTKLCQQIKDNFSKIIFLPISNSPDWKEMFRRLWCDLVNRSNVPQFVSVEDAHQQLMSHACDRKRDETTVLVVLDDVWKESDLEKFLIRKPGFKTIITSRMEFKKSCNWTYPVKELSIQDSEHLFLHYALASNDDRQNLDHVVVEKIVKGCKCHPLALKVIGTSLEGTWRWQEIADELHKGQILNDYDPDQQILTRLETSLKPLTRKQLECFMDLGLFLHNKRIRATAVMDMWAEIRGLNEDSARGILEELSNRHLLELFERTGTEENFSNLFVEQHDLLNELAVHYSRKTGQKRLIIDQDNLPYMEQNKNITSQAQIVSIHAGWMKSSEWPDLLLPRAEVLILNFSSSCYCLPPFLEKMENLKVLIIANNGLIAAKISGFPQSGTLKNLKRVRLEKISLPIECNSTEAFEGLQKLSMILCEVDQGDSPPRFNAQAFFPVLTEVEIEYCNGLERLPSENFHFVNLKKLSITNCHDLTELPEEIGWLDQLEVLRLKACTNLECLPESLSGLEKLKFLDVSDCCLLSKLPESISQLRSLRKIDMRECSALLPSSVRDMVGLRTVICNENTAKLWEPFKIYLGALELDVRKQIVDLYFLR